MVAEKSSEVLDADASKTTKRQEGGILLFSVGTAFLLGYVIGNRRIVGRGGMMKSI